MKNALLLMSIVILKITAVWDRACAQAPATGISWGFNRTYWDGKWYQDGYAEAGTGGALLSLRREMPVGAQTAVSFYFSFMWMRHTTTTLIEPVIVDPESDTVIGGGMMATQTHRTYFREYDLGFNIHRYLTTEGPSIYFGGGPSIRWGQAAKLDIEDERPGDIHKAAWFGLTLLAGYRTTMNGKTTFFEPQLTFSPDPADRWQETYPPVNFTIQMGLLW